MLARVFTVLGTRFPDGGGVAAYTTAGLGKRAGRAVAWCFLVGVITGAPVVCLIGGSYVAVLVGGGRTAGLVASALLLAVVIGLTMAGARAGGAVQLGLVAVLTGLVAVAVTGSAPSARAANWTPFLPGGWISVGQAMAVLMMSFVGWEAIAPLTARLRDPGRQLPRIVLLALAVTSVLYLALAASTVAVLGAGAGSEVPLSLLLRKAVGPVGPAVAAVAAVALTLAATNAYLTGAAALAAGLRAERPGSPAGGARRLQLAVGATGLVVLGAAGLGLLDTSRMVALPTTLFLIVYLGATASAVRLFRGWTRVVAAVSCAAVAGILFFSGWSLAAAALVVGTGLAWPVRRPRRDTEPERETVLAR
jgi:amino acid efflux transporter